MLPLQKNPLLLPQTSCCRQLGSPELRHPLCPFSRKIRAASREEGESVAPKTERLLAPRGRVFFGSPGTCWHSVEDNVGSPFPLVLRAPASLSNPDFFCLSPWTGGCVPNPPARTQSDVAICYKKPLAFIFLVLKRSTLPATLLFSGWGRAPLGKCFLVLFFF